MGTGRFKDGKFDLVIVANFEMSASDWTEWERGFAKASEILYNASEGQMEFGKLFVCDDSVGLSTADVILYPAGDPSYSMGTFGTPGDALHLMPYVKYRILSIVHEMGHHVWDLGDEYCQAYITDDIDDTDPAPDRRTIPIFDSGRADNELADQDADALLLFGGLPERHNIIADTATSLTVDADFSDLPTNADHGLVWIQIPAECAEVTRPNYCIMEKSRGAAGYFDEVTGAWVEVAHPVTEFCTEGNHDPDRDTAQEARHGKSCWETIPDRAEFARLAVPDPAAEGPTESWTEPEWIILDKQPRFALVLDRSDSMSTGHKMADTQYGAVYWLEHCALDDDLLTIIWYDHDSDEILELTEVSTIPDLDAVIADINALTPRGATNIRDGLYRALDQISSLPTRAAVQVAVLLTDGKHNTPFRSEATEVLPSFQEGGVRIYSLGVGDAAAVEMDALDELGAETGGDSYAVGDDRPGEIHAAMMDIDAAVRGGIITTEPVRFPDTRSSEMDEILSEMMLDDQERPPPLPKLLEALQISDIKQVIHPSEPLKGRLAAIPVDIEKGCEKASFSLAYPKDQDLWLYLIDPRGQLVDMFSPPVRYVISSVPHRFAVVERPAAGRWYMLAFRPKAGAAFTFYAVAGGENRQLQVFGGARPKNHAKAPVRLWASARWRDALSNLRVTATVVAPDGTVQRVRLDDHRFTEPNSGIYEGFVTVKEPGRYRGTILIENLGKAIVAKPARRMLDQENDELVVASGAPKFVRRVRFYFDSGDRPEIVDEEQAKGLTAQYETVRPRPTPLKSAPRTTGTSQA